MSAPTLREQVRASEAGSITQRCAALGLSRNSYYYQPRDESAANLRLMRRACWTRHCFLGVRGLHAWLRQQGEAVNLKRVRRLVRLMTWKRSGPSPTFRSRAKPRNAFPTCCASSGLKPSMTSGAPTSRTCYRAAFCIW